MKPFLLISTRDNDRAALAEYASVARHAGLDPDDLVHVRLEAAPLTDFDLNLDAFAGIFLGGSSFNVSDADKSPLQQRVEDDLMDVMSQAGRDLLESEMAYVETQEGHFEKRCPHCGGTDVQFYGQQTVEVTEDWSEGDSRDNFEFPEGPSGKWQNCTGHCLTCGEEWEVIPDSESE